MILHMRKTGSPVWHPRTYCGRTVARNQAARLRHVTCKSCLKTIATKETT